MLNEQQTVHDIRVENDRLLRLRLDRRLRCLRRLSVSHASGLLSRLTCPPRRPPTGVVFRPPIHCHVRLLALVACRRSSAASAPSSHRCQAASEPRTRVTFRAIARPPCDIGTIYPCQARCGCGQGHRQPPFWRAIPRRFQSGDTRLTFTPTRVSSRGPSPACANWVTVRSAASRVSART